MDKGVRNQMIDAARGLAMLLVLYGHALEMFFPGRADGRFSPFAFEAWRMIFAFHMPAFYFVSGLVSANLGAKPFGKILASAIALLLFADITHLLAAPLQAAALYHQGHSLAFIAGQVLSPLLSGEGFNLVVTWFLVSLVFVQIFAWSYLHIPRAARWTILAFTAGLYVVFQISGYQLFQFSTWGAGLVFFLMGCAAERRQARMEENARPRTAPGEAGPFRQRRSLFYFLIGCIAVAEVAILYPLNRGCSIALDAVCHPYKGTNQFAVLLVDGHLGFLPLFFLTAAPGIAAVIAFAEAMQGTSLTDAMAWIGRNTLPLLILNGLVLAFVEHRLAGVLPFSDGAMAAMTWAAALTLAQLAVLPLVKPALDWLYAQCRMFSQQLVSRLWRSAPERPAI